MPSSQAMQSEEEKKKSAAVVVGLAKANKATRNRFALAGGIAPHILYRKDWLQ